MNSLIILAGGEGTRAQQKHPKQFTLLDDKDSMSRILYSQYPYKTTDYNFQFDEIITVVNEDWRNLIKKEVSNVSKVVSGGRTRTESSYLGLKACSKKCEKVLIHDAARPFASNKVFNECINNLEKFDSVIPIIEQKDTLLLKKDQKIEYLNRSNIKLIQTPQGFKYDLIFKAYNNMIKSETDDLQILLQHKPNASIKFIKGSEKNFKITTEYEINLLKHLYKNKGLWENLYE